MTECVFFGAGAALAGISARTAGKRASNTANTTVATNGRRPDLAVCLPVTGAKNDNIAYLRDHRVPATPSLGRAEIDRTSHEEAIGTTRSWEHPQAAKPTEE